MSLVYNGEARTTFTAKNKTQRELGTLRAGLTSVEKAAAALGVTFGAVSASLAVQKLVEINAQYQKLQASLAAVTGSQSEANQVFERLEEFSNSTPYQLNQITEAYIQMRALGLNPTEDALTSFGNTAAAMGKDINQMVEAVADAATGEYERLKEFGIKAQSEGDRVSFIFQGVKTTVEKNAADIQKYLQSIGDEKFGDAMALQMDTIGGAMSNMRGEFDSLIATLGDAGANNTVVWAIHETTDSIRILKRGILDLEAFLESSTIGENLGSITQDMIKQLPVIREWSMVVDLLERYQNRDMSGERIPMPDRPTELPPVVVTPQGQDETPFQGFGGPGFWEMQAQDEISLQRRIDYNNQKYEAEIELANQMKDLWIGYDQERMDAQDRSLAYEQQINSMREAATLSMLGNMQQIGEAFGRKGFEVAKAAAIGETIINTFKAATGAYSAMAGIPYIGPALGIAAAAAATAAGLANVKKIQEQKYGGSGSPSTSSVNAGVGTSGTVGGVSQDGVVTQPTNANQDSGQTLTVILKGMVSDAYIEDELIPKINDAGKRNVKIEYES